MSTSSGPDCGRYSADRYTPQCKRLASIGLAISLILSLLVIISLYWWWKQKLKKVNDFDSEHDANTDREE